MDEQQYKDDRGEWRVSVWKKVGSIHARRYVTKIDMHTHYEIANSTTDQIIETGHVEWCEGCNKNKA